MVQATRYRELPMKLRFSVSATHGISAGRASPGGRPYGYCLESELRIGGGSPLRQGAAEAASLQEAVGGTRMSCSCCSPTTLR